VNFLQGIAIQVYHWHGEEDIPVINPKEVTGDGSAYAIVAYSEIKRDNMSTSGNHDWYTYKTSEGNLHLDVVDPSDKGGAKGTIDFTVYMVEPEKPGKTLEDLPLVHFTGAFNIRPSNASKLYTGK
jgi:hypothetical protein